MGEGAVGGSGGGCAGAGSGSGGDRCARLLELVKDVSSHLDVTALCHKIFLHINELIAADRYSLFLVWMQGQELGVELLTFIKTCAELNCTTLCERVYTTLRFSSKTL